MPKKKAPKRKAAKKAKAAVPNRARSAKRRAPVKQRSKSKPKTKTTIADYGPTFFLTAQSDTSAAYEIDGTPHDRTIQSYRVEKANIREFEEQDGKILYKVKRLKSAKG